MHDAGFAWVACWTPDAHIRFPPTWSKMTAAARVVAAAMCRTVILPPRH